MPLAVRLQIRKLWAMDNLHIFLGATVADLSNQEAFEREKRYIYFCDPYEPINKNRLEHSKII